MALEKGGPEIYEAKPEEAEHSDSRDSLEDGAGDDQNDGSQASDGPSRKRRRSRKGLGKRFECTSEGCGKSYSRAEHLYRHQLNHNSKQTYHCQYPGCTRTFVRGDLLKRHMDRHTAKGSQLNRRSSLASQNASGRPASPGLSAPPSGKEEMKSSLALDTQGASQNTYHAGSLTPPAVYNSGMSLQGIPGFDNGGGHLQHSPSMHHESAAHVNNMGNAYGMASPHAHVHGTFGSCNASPHTTPHATPVTFVSQQNVMPFHLPPAQYVHSPIMSPHEASAPFTGAAQGEYSETMHPQSMELAMLDQMSMPGNVPVFGDGANKSPYVGMPEDFMAYLFNSPAAAAAAGSQSPVIMHNQYPNYGDLNSSNYTVPFMNNEGAGPGFFTGVHQVMAVTNLLDQNVPEATISDEKSQEIYDFICDRFHENEHVPPSERQRDTILTGDHSNDNHMLSKRMMQLYIGSYWYHFSDQLPILHKPTFSPDKTPHLLLLAMMTIGAACLDRTEGFQVTQAGAKLSNFLAWHLRWEIFMDTSFRPPAKLWVFQTLILLEMYEKMYSTRELHERAHIHHATMITLMRRGRSLIGKTTMDSPFRENGSAKSSTPGIAHSPDEWWNQWIVNESTRRAAFAAFVIDSIHATMFGHSGVMAAHEMRLPLPCDESLWSATSSAEVGRVESNLMSRGIKPISFLEGLKRTLSNTEVRTNSFGRTVLMAGLLSVTWHMHQRDLQINVLGGGVTQALGGRDKWRSTLIRAYDAWKADFDRALGRDEACSDPYRHDAQKRMEVSNIFDGRTVLHNLAHMAMHADIVDCQMFAKAKRLLGRAIGPNEFNSAQRRIKDFWAPSARARDATYFALKFLSSVLVPNDVDVGIGPPRPACYNRSDVDLYEARDDALLNRSWVMYFAALVVWSYGFALEGPCTNVPSPTTKQEKLQRMREYLIKFGNVTDPNTLRSTRGLNNNTALLMVLKDGFQSTRWELLHEGSSLINNCILLNQGLTP